MTNDSEIPEISSLARVQDCLEDAPECSDEAMDKFSYRCSRELKERAERICAARNKKLSGFIRTCLARLVHEWGSADSVG